MRRSCALCTALYCCFVALAAAGQCDYTSKAKEACDETANYGSCADYFQVFATMEKQYFNSPNYPNSYPNNIVCRWVISGCACYDPSNPTATFKVEVEVLDFDMQNSPSCTKDYLEIKDGKRLWYQKFSQFCGKRCPGDDTENTTRSFGKHLLATFQTDVFDSADPAEHRGFNASYRCVPVLEPQYDDVVLGPMNYLLIAFSCFLFILFGCAAALLVVQESRRSRKLVR